MKISNKLSWDYGIEIGQKFFDWTVCSPFVFIKNNNRYLLCRDGSFPVESVKLSSLLNGSSKRSNKRRHGILSKEQLSLKPRYFSIKRRCESTSCISYKNYGGRGIKFNFSSLKEFSEYVISLDGFSFPLGSSQLDRIDNNKSYEKGNLRWVSPSENALNRRNSCMILLDGKKIHLKKYHEKYCVPISYRYFHSLYMNNGSIELKYH